MNLLSFPLTRCGPNPQPSAIPSMPLSENKAIKLQKTISTVERAAISSIRKIRGKKHAKKDKVGVAEAQEAIHPFAKKGAADVCKSWGFHDPSNIGNKKKERKKAPTPCRLKKAPIDGNPSISDLFPWEQIEKEAFSSPLQKASKRIPV